MYSIMHGAIYCFLPSVVISCHVSVLCYVQKLSLIPPKPLISLKHLWNKKLYPERVKKKKGEVIWNCNADQQLLKHNLTGESLSLSVWKKCFLFRSGHLFLIFFFWEPLGGTQFEKRKASKNLSRLLSLSWDLARNFFNLVFYLIFGLRHISTNI